jgi:tetratricopeptide (TPR) repeat protein
MISIKPALTFGSVPLLLLIFSLNSNAQVAGPPSSDNQRSKVCQWMGEVEVCITYNSPDVTLPSGKSRLGEIWGKLVPYGLSQERWLESGSEPTVPKPWRAGANENTVITFSHDVLIEGKQLMAGAYGLFFIAGEKEWELILSKDSKKWGAYLYNEKNDALRVKIIPAKAPYREWLTYDFTTKNPSSTTLVMLWEELQVPIHISISDNHKIYIEQIKNDLASKKIFYWYDWHDAAKYCLDNNVELELGLQWAEKSINHGWIGNANFATLKTKAEILSALGRKKEADSLMQFTIRYEGGVFELHNYGRELLQKKKVDEAMKVFKLNATKNPDYWVPQFGLARGYAAMGDFKTALKYANAAKKIIPRKELGERHWAIDFFIEQIEKKEIPSIYLAPGFVQAY